MYGVQEVLQRRGGKVFVLINYFVSDVKVVWEKCFYLMRIRVCILQFIFVDDIKIYILLMFFIDVYKLDVFQEIERRVEQVLRYLIGFRIGVV